MMTQWKQQAESLWNKYADTGWTGDAAAIGHDEFVKAIGEALGEIEPCHQTGCICADCSGAELTADND